jgi:hypothetical protein
LQIKKIQEVGRAYEVVVTVKKMDGIIELHGKGMDIIKTQKDIHDLIKKAEQEDFIAKMVQWYYMEVSTKFVILFYGGMKGLTYLHLPTTLPGA